jgi:hypothetical protein
MPELYEHVQHRRPGTGHPPQQPHQPAASARTMPLDYTRPSVSVANSANRFLNRDRSR